MTTLAETTTAVRPAVENAEPSIYLTDGLRPFRLVRGASWPPETSHVVLEDCRTLEDRPYSIDKLSAMGLSTVGGPGSRAFSSGAARPRRPARRAPRRSLPPPA